MTEHDSLAAALVAALSDLTVVEKGRKANAGSYSYDYAALIPGVELVSGEVSFKPKPGKHEQPAWLPLPDEDAA